MMDTPRTPARTLLEARRVATAAGMRYVYTGNISDEPSQSTWCHVCGTRVIGRDWYDLTAWQLTQDGRCAACDTPCAGVFEGPPGTWGRRRQPLLMNAGA